MSAALTGRMTNPARTGTSMALASIVLVQLGLAASVGLIDRGCGWPGRR